MRKNYEFFNDVKSKPILQKPVCGSSFGKRQPTQCIFVCIFALTLIKGYFNTLKIAG